MDMDEAAAYLGVVKQTLYKWVNERRIPVTKVGRLNKFNRTLLDVWLKKRTVMPMPERVVARVVA